jgi:hypothetical protein
MSYLPELDDRRQEIRRAAGQRIVCWPKVAGVGNVFVDQASCSVRMPTGAELAAAACTLAEFGEVDEEVHRLSVDFDASGLALGEGYQVVFVFEYEDVEYQETVRFDVVHEPWAGHDISLNDLRDEVSAVGEILDGLARAKAGSGTSRTAEQEASVFAVKACQQVKGWIRQQLTARGRVYPRLILQREELRQVVAAQAVALIYRSAGGASSGRYADLATQWADEARDRFTALGEMPYDADEDSVADDVIGGFTSITLRRGGPRASSFAAPTATPAALPSLVIGGGGSGDTVDEASVRTALAGSLGDVALNGQAITSVGDVDGVDVSALPATVTAAADAAAAAQTTATNAGTAAAAAQTTATNAGTAAAAAQTTATNAGTAAAAAQTTANAAIPASTIPTNGDLLTRAGGNLARLAVGAEGQRLRVNSGAPAFGYIIDPRRETYHFTDFYEATIAAAGMNVSGFGNPIGNSQRPGVSTWTNNSATVGYISLFASAGASSVVVLGAGEAYFECSFQVPAVSDGTDNFTLYIGLHDSTAAGDCVDGVGFRYNHAVNSGNWQFVARSNSLETAVNTSTALTVGTAAGDWVTYGVLVNAAGTLATGYINGVSIGTVSTNIPTGGTRATGAMMKVDRTAGTTARLFIADYFFLWRAITR